MEIHKTKDIGLVDRYIAMLYICEDNIINLVNGVKCGDSEVCLLSSAAHICCEVVTMLFPERYKTIYDFRTSKSYGAIHRLYQDEFKKFNDFNELCEFMSDTLKKVFEFADSPDDKYFVEDCMNGINDIKNKYKSCTSLGISEQ